MIEKIIKHSIEHKLAILACSLLIIFIGLYKTTKLSIDALPDVTNVQVSVVTKASGLSPSEVEQLVTYPLELSLNGMPGVSQIRSISRTAVSSVTVIFNDNVDIYFARQLVSQRISQTEIPAGLGKPELSPITTALGDIYELVLISLAHSPEELRTYLDWHLGPKLKAIPGIIDINVFGGELKQYHISVDPIKLAHHSLRLPEIIEKLKHSNINIGGGYIQKGPEQWVIQGKGQFKNLQDLKKFPVKTLESGQALLLEQISKISIGSALRYGAITKANQGEVVGMTVTMLKGESSKVVVHTLKQRLKEIEKGLPAGMKIQTVYDRSEFISRTLKTVFINLLEGALLVVLILYFAFGSFKGACLVGSAIPFSMLFAIIFMEEFGIVGNLMSLGAIDFGLLVDGGVVIFEAVLTVFMIKGIHSNSKECIQSACVDVGKASIFSVLIILLVYLPLITLEGVEGKMFKPMALTVALALAGSVIFSLTTFPASLVLLYKKPVIHHPHFWDTVAQYYKESLQFTQHKPKFVIMGASILLILAFMLVPFLGTEFLPRIDEGEIVVDIRRLPSTSLNYSKFLNEEIEKVLMAFPEVVSAVSRSGRGESPNEPKGTEESEIMVKLKKKDQWKTANNLESLMMIMKESILKKVPSSYISMSQPIENRVNELISGSKADVVIKIYGDDLLTLKNLAEKFTQRVKKVTGTADLRVQRILGLPMIEIKVNQEKLSHYGVNAQDILTTVRALKVGVEAGKVYEGLKNFDVVLNLLVDASSLESIENVPVITSRGKTVPLGMVAEITKIEGPAVIYREDLKRRVFVEMNVFNRDLGSYVHAIQDATKDLVLQMPQGYSVAFGGQFENFTRAKNRLLLVVPIILLIISGMLIFAFNDFRLAICVFLMIPFSLIGGIFTLFIRSMPFSIPAAVGFIALTGITVLTGIVFITTFKRVHKGNLGELDKDLIQTGVESIRANLTTALIAVIGFLPMAFSTGAGAEVQRPLASVVVGGIIAGSILTQLLLPECISFLYKKSFKK